MHIKLTEYNSRASTKIHIIAPFRNKAPRERQHLKTVSHNETFQENVSRNGS